MDEQVLAATRRALHAVGELVIAGPQHAAHGTIRLRVTPGGFGGVVSPVRVEGADLVWDGGRAPITGTCRDLASAAGLEARAPEVYEDGSGVGPDDELTVDADAATLLGEWFARGDAALRAFAPDVEPVLWPEHFDLGIALGEVNYGISPGDSGHETPYAYVGPWTTRTGDFWNAPFGSQRAAADLTDAEAVTAYFTEGRAAL